MNQDDTIRELLDIVRTLVPRYYEEGRDLERERNLELARDVLGRLLEQRLGEAPTAAMTCIEACDDIEHLFEGIAAVAAAASSDDALRALNIREPPAGGLSEAKGRRQHRPYYSSIARRYYDAGRDAEHDRTCAIAERVLRRVLEGKPAEVPPELLSEIDLIHRVDDFLECLAGCAAAANTDEVARALKARGGDLD